MTKIALFLIDGLRPDGLMEAQTPVIDELIAYGASTMTARTVMPTITLPCVASLFLACPPEHHGIKTNVWSPEKLGTGLMEAIAETGRKVVTFYNWEHLRDISRPGALHASFFLRNDMEPEGRGDSVLTTLALNYLEGIIRQPVAHATGAVRQDLDFIFIYLGYTDTAGHEHGWMSKPYLRAIENADACVGRVVRRLQEEHDGWGMVVTSDHGGHGTQHGTDSDEDTTVPFVMYGNPAFAPGEQLADPVNIIDIAPTIAAWMNVPPAPSWDGRPLQPANLTVDS